LVLLFVKFNPILVEENNAVDDKSEKFVPPLTPKDTVFVYLLINGREFGFIAAFLFKLLIQLNEFI
jgi:hypothetical protein